MLVDEAREDDKSLHETKQKKNESVQQNINNLIFNNLILK